MRCRNASSHFRIRPIYDDFGLCIDDKLLLFDEDKNGRNFTLVIDREKFLEITRKVDITINAQVSKDTPSVEIETGGHKK